VRRVSSRELKVPEKLLNKVMSGRKIGIFVGGVGVNNIGVGGNTIIEEAAIYVWVIP